MLKHAETISGSKAGRAPGAVTSGGPIRNRNVAAANDPNPGLKPPAGKTGETRQPGAAFHAQYTWEEWFRLYKIEAGRVNPMLAVNAQGNSVLDFTDKAPLHDAHGRNMCPRTFGRLSARQFEI